jgi:hypothetical protein
MLSTLFFLLLLAFQLWYLSSRQLKTQPEGYQVYVARNPRPARLAGWALAGLAAALFVGQLGWMTGLCVWLVGLMGVGNLVVTLAPFRYLRWPATVAIYLVFLTLEVTLS